jgi:hypothetical protein
VVISRSLIDGVVVVVVVSMRYGPAKDMLVDVIVGSGTDKFWGVVTDGWDGGCFCNGGE